MGSPSPGAFLSTTALIFPDETVGTASQSQSVTLSNHGNAVLDLASITVSTNFEENNTCGSTLASGANCTINVIFAPATTGS